MKPLLIALASPVSLLQELSDHGIDEKFRPSENNSAFNLESEKGNRFLKLCAAKQSLWE